MSHNNQWNIGTPFFIRGVVEDTQPILKIFYGRTVSGGTLWVPFKDAEIPTDAITPQPEQRLYNVQKSDPGGGKWVTVITFQDESSAIGEAEFLSKRSIFKYRVTEVRSNVCWESDFKKEETATL